VKYSESTRSMYVTRGGVVASITPDTPLKGTDPSCSVYLVEASAICLNEPLSRVLRASVVIGTKVYWSRERVDHGCDW
jgi:hypothetical protein